jgi:hypothetical protein
MTLIRFLSVARTVSGFGSAAFAAASATGTLSRGPVEYRDGRLHMEHHG